MTTVCILLTTEAAAPTEEGASVIKTNYEKVVESFDDMDLKDDLLVSVSLPAFCGQQRTHSTCAPAAPLARLDAAL